MTPGRALCLLILIALQTEAKTITTSIGSNGSIDWGDPNSLNWKLNAILFGVIVWVLKESYSSYVKSKDRTGEKLEKVADALSRIEERLKQTPTHDDVHDQIREEISYYESLRK